MATKMYHYNGVTIELEPGWARIHNNNALKSYLTKWGHGTRPMVQNILSEYKKFFGKKLNISEDSMVVEILVHYHCDGVLKIGSAALVTAGIPGAVAAVILQLARVAAYSHLEKFDCGEYPKDSDRHKWDSIQGVSGILETLLVD